MRDDNGGLHYTFSTDNSRRCPAGHRRRHLHEEGLLPERLRPIGLDLFDLGGRPGRDAVRGRPRRRDGLVQGGRLADRIRAVPDVHRCGARLDRPARPARAAALAVFSQDVAWDFSDPTSPDYTAARKTWFENELKATWQADPTTFSLMRGIRGGSDQRRLHGRRELHADSATAARATRSTASPPAGASPTSGSDNDTPIDDIAHALDQQRERRRPRAAVWGGTPRKVSSNFFEWSQLNAATADDMTRSDILDKTLIWLVGHDHPDGDGDRAERRRERHREHRLDHLDRGDRRRLHRRLRGRSTTATTAGTAGP